MVYETAAERVKSKGLVLPGCSKAMAGNEATQVCCRRDSSPVYIDPGRVELK